MYKINKKNIWLLLKTGIVVLIILVVKFFLHRFGLEVGSINTLFSGIVAANVFLMGFLLSGVLSDYKESEKIPGEIATSLSLIFEEFHILYRKKGSETARAGMVHVQELAQDFFDWFYRRTRTKDLVTKLQGLNDLYYDIEPITQANFIVRMKQEMGNLKRIVIRTDTIRDTDFISSGYLIATTITLLLCSGLTLAKLEPLYESFFYTGVISFLVIFLLLLIHDLDNPFGYKEQFSAENVSLYPIEKMIEELKEKV